MRKKAIRSDDEHVGGFCIVDAETLLESTLNNSPFQDCLAENAMQFLAPAGYRAVVELCGEDGRGKREHLPASKWSPDTDEIRIYFEPDINVDIESLGGMDSCVRDLCEALATAEDGKHNFISLKWFRDSFLTRKSNYRWANYPRTRQSVLEEAIAQGLVVVGKVANPKNPDFPTSTIQLYKEADNLDAVEVGDE